MLLMTTIKPNDAELPLYVGRCACPKDWDLVVGMRGKCGRCKEVPVFVRHVSWSEIRGEGKAA